VVVRLYKLVLAFLVSGLLKSNVGEHFVGIHIRRSARATLIPIDQKLVVVLAVEDRLAGFFNSRQLFTLHCADVGICTRGGKLHERPRFHKSRIVIDAHAGYLKVLKRTQGLHAVVGLSRNLLLAEEVLLYPDFVLGPGGRNEDKAHHSQTRHQTSSHHVLHPVARLELWLLLLHRRPRLVRIKAFHSRKELQRLGSEVLFVHYAVVADHEALHTGGAVFSGRCHQRESSDHHPLDHEIHLPKRGSGTLALQYLEEGAVKRFIPVAVTSLNSLGYVLADRPFPLAVGGLPREAILLAGCADDPLGVLIYVVARALLQGVLVLRFHVASTNLNGVELIPADAAIEDFLLTRFRVK